MTDMFEASSDVLSKLGLSKAVQAIHDNKFTGEDLVDAYAAVIEARDPCLQVFATLLAKTMSHTARRVGRFKDERRGALHGIPVTVPATFDVFGARCGWGVDAYSERFPEEDAQIVALLRRHGAIMMGTTNTSEFGHFQAGPARNVHNPARAAGGGAGGAAVAVAAAMTPLAIAAQTDGSILRAASYNGVVGFKATKDTIVSRGATPIISSLGQFGFFVRSVGDALYAARLLMDNVAARQLPKNLSALPGDTRVFVLDSSESYHIDAAGRTALNRAATMLADAGLAVERLKLPPEFVEAQACYDMLFAQEFSDLHANDRDVMSAVAADCLERGQSIRKHDLQDKMRTANNLRKKLNDILAGNVVFLDAATGDTAPEWTNEPVEPELQLIWSLVGFPSMSVPAGLHDGLPIGVQLIATEGREDLMFYVAHVLEANGLNR